MPTPSATPSPVNSPLPQPVATTSPAAKEATDAPVIMLPLVQLAMAAEPQAPPTGTSKAVTWALSELTSPDPSWSDELSAPWSGYCEAFVEIAYGARHQYANALANYKAQRAAGRVHLEGVPPDGALVFYSGGNDGHVALSAGEGKVVTTWGYLGQRYAVREVPVRSFENPYLGWSAAPAGWSGR
jgi:hypothetical protein